MRAGMTTRAAVAAASMALALAGAGCGSDEGGDSAGGGEPIKVGMVASITGPAATFGVAEANGARAVVGDINRSGGIDGRKVELVEFDDKTDPTEAARGASELVTRDEVVAIIGPTTGSSTLALAPIASQAKVPFFSGAGTAALADRNADFYPWSFLSVPNDKVVVPAIFERIVERGHRRIGIFFQEDAFGDFGVEAFKALARQSGKAEIVSDRGAPLTATNVNAQATALRNSDVDAVIMQISSAQLGSAFVRAARQVGLDAELYGQTGLAQPAFLQIAGPAANGTHFLVAIDPKNLTAEQQRLYDLLEDEGIEPTGGFGELVYASAMRKLAAALKESGGEGGEALQSALNGDSKAESYWRVPVSFSEDDHDGLSADAFEWAVATDGAFDFAAAKEPAR